MKISQLRRGAVRAFSLVEVVIALGIIVFCLTGIVGFLAVCMKSSQESKDTTADTLLFQKVVNQLRVHSSDYTNPQQVASDSKDTSQKDLFPLPALNKADTKGTTFTVDSLNKYLETIEPTATRASMKTGDPVKVVNVMVLNPSEFQLSTTSTNSKAPQLPDGKVAFIRVAISPANGFNKPSSPPSVFITELNLLTQ